MATATVPVKSAFWSSINWTQGIALLASIVAVFGVNLDPQTQVAIVALIQAAQTIVTWCLRTFFSASVTPESASRLSQ